MWHKFLPCRLIMEYTPLEVLSYPTHEPGLWIKDNMIDQVVNLFPRTFCYGADGKNKYIYNLVVVYQAGYIRGNVWNIALESQFLY